MNAATVYGPNRGTNYATARYLLLYLQEKNLLKAQQNLVASIAPSFQKAGLTMPPELAPADLAQLHSVSLADSPILVSPANTPWLKPDECFVASVVTFE